MFTAIYKICGRPGEDFSCHPHFRKQEYFSFWPHLDDTRNCHSSNIKGFLRDSRYDSRGKLLFT